MTGAVSGGEGGVAGRVHQVRVQQVAEQLDAVDQARAGLGEGGGGVDREDPLGPERGDPLPVLHRLGLGVLDASRRASRSRPRR